MMMDTHIHTKYSKDADSLATFEAYINRALELNISHLIFTDHHDIDPAHPLFKIPIDYDMYVKDFEKIKKNSKVKVSLGVEVGYQTHVKDEIKTFLNMYPFEFVILSIHYIEKKDLYSGEYFKGKTKFEAYDLYFKTCLEAILEIDDFHTFGHLDYIPRYAPYDDYVYEDHKDRIDLILKALISKGKMLEINTSGFVTEKRMYPKIDMIDRYFELGGTYISIGSDAHNVNELGRYFDLIPKKYLDKMYVRG
jgi:histidinol-phosphatase (PHP family)